MCFCCALDKTGECLGRGTESARTVIARHAMIAVIGRTCWCFGGWVARERTIRGWVPGVSEKGKEGLASKNRKWLGENVVAKPWRTDYRKFTSLPSS